MQKTAMQILIDHLDPIHSGILNKAIHLRDTVEKQQIINGVLFGVEQLCDNGDVENDNRAEQYYYETYEAKTVH
jgi:hypothetical protein